MSSGLAASGKFFRESADFLSERFGPLSQRFEARLGTCQRLQLNFGPVGVGQDLRDIGAVLALELPQVRQPLFDGRQTLRVSLDGIAVSSRFGGNVL